MQTLSIVVLVVFVYYAPTIYKKIVNNLRLRSIPTVGPSDPLTSYIGGYRFQKHGKDMVQEGYHKYRGSIFKIPTMTNWMIIASGPDKVEEIRRTPDSILSMKDALDGAAFIREMIRNSAQVVKTPLTRSVKVKFPDVRDEIITAFDDHIPVRSDEWIKIKAYPIIMDIVCRATNRMLVGLPLCRDPDYLELNKTFTIDLMRSSFLINTVPAILRPVFESFLNVTKGVERGMRHIGPFVKERLEQEARYGKDWAERPNDIMSWLDAVSGGKERSVREITKFILFINFAAIHTTSRIVTHSLYNLATYPEYVQPLREEIEAVLQETGWSTASVAKMTKLDSFVKETMRLSPLAVSSMRRIAMKDFTFSDGMTIPAGNMVTIPAWCIHIDPDNYADAGTFDGFRFEKMGKKEGESSKYLLVSLDLDYLLFGHGVHACPGRFFAAHESKAMLAHILLNYDVKMADGGGRPADVWHGRSASPNTKAEVLFRKRV